MTYWQNITNEQVNQLPTGAFGGHIVVADNPQAMQQAADSLKNCPVIGFDTETRPSFRKGQSYPLALVQLCSGSTAFLLRVDRAPLPPDILSILQDETVLKVGASIRDDIRAIQRQTPFHPAGFVDIQSVVGRYGIAELSVRKAAGIVLGVRISKAQRLSNWQARELTDAQQLYAATDAWACREIYLKLTGNNPNTQTL